MTLSGIDGDPQRAGNPAMRWMMFQFGPAPGIIMQKTGVGILATLIALYGERAIRNRARWLAWVPTSRWGKSWLRQKNRSWIAYLPLYGAAVSQLLAALSWVFMARYY